jgi:hypothetical protein
LKMLLGLIRRQHLVVLLKQELLLPLMLLQELLVLLLVMVLDLLDLLGGDAMNLHRLNKLRILLLLEVLHGSLVLLVQLVELLQTRFRPIPLIRRVICTRMHLREPGDAIHSLLLQELLLLHLLLFLRLPQGLQLLLELELLRGLLLVDRGLEGGCLVVANALLPKQLLQRCLRQGLM